MFDKLNHLEMKQLEYQRESDEEFTDGDNIADFQKIMAVIASINANALQTAA